MDEQKLKDAIEHVLNGNQSRCLDDEEDFSVVLEDLTTELYPLFNEKKGER